MLIWFDAKLELIMDELWMSSPSSAFALHEQMSQKMMTALRAAIPEVALHGCAPLPEWQPKLQPVLRRFGVLQRCSGQLNRGYAILTFRPWLGGCSVCCLHQGHDATPTACSRQISRVHGMF